MGLVQITVYPFLVDRIAAAVLGKTVHVAGGLLEAGKILVVAVDKHILVVYVVARQEQSDRGGKRQAAVGAVGGQTLISVVGADLARKVVGIRKGMEAEHLVADTHLPCREIHILQTRYIRHGEGKIFLDDA